MQPRFSLKQRIALAFIPPLAAALIRLLGATLRYRDAGALDWHVEKNAETRVYCMWHRCLLASAPRFRKMPIAILISASFDGELIARTVARLGYTPVRGSSTRGGASGLLGMQTALERVRFAAFTADGPRGPVYRAKPGAVKLAQQAGGGVGIYFVLPARAWTLRSWDGFLIPKPFSPVYIAWEPPVPVPATADDAAIEAARVAVEQALERARATAEQCVALGRVVSSALIQ
jgi:lysophospholipid acyltransferase (LPLAT)-like uncharacterized protein